MLVLILCSVKEAMVGHGLLLCVLVFRHVCVLKSKTKKVSVLGDKRVNEN